MSARTAIGGAPVQSRGNVRIIAPGQIITEDFREDQLNLEVHAAHNKRGVLCQITHIRVGQAQSRHAGLHLEGAGKRTSAVARF